MPGKVSIIGVGPGDHKLITIKAVECIGRADVIVYDRLINKKILEYAKPDAELIYAGKEADCHSMPQSKINEVLVEKAKQGKHVARIKGGDPFLFGRGGEEAEWAYENGIEFEIVPGITSAIAAPAYAGIPVTHREHCSSLHIITGHQSAEKEDTLDFGTLAKLEGTLVFLMGIRNIKRISEGLIRNGKEKNAPAAVIEKGTVFEQKVVKGTLENIARITEQAEISSPAVIVIGSVVDLEEKLRWFPNGKLAGKKVLVTRPDGQTGSLAEKIEELGGKAIETPVVLIKETEDFKPLDDVMNRINEFRWLAFTSVNGVKIFFNRIKHTGRDIRSLHHLKICAIGTSTAAALQDLGLNVEYIPEEFTTAALLEGLKGILEKGEKLLLVRAEVEEDELLKALEASEMEYENISVYKTLVNWSVKDEIIEVLKESKPDFLTFTSPSTVKSLVSLAGKENMQLLSCIAAVCIGPVTARTARGMGFYVAGVADVHTTEGLVDKLVQIVEG